MHKCSNTAKALTFQLEIFNAEVLFREDATPDDFIDVVVGNRVYMPCLYVRELLCLHWGASDNVRIICD